MSDPDEAMVEAVARAINAADNEWADAPRTTPHEVWPTHVARAVLSVPAIGDALAGAEKLTAIRHYLDSLLLGSVNGDPPVPEVEIIEHIAALAAPLYSGTAT